jgi:hypothetical protein
MDSEGMLKERVEILEDKVKDRVKIVKMEDIRHMKGLTNWNRKLPGIR